MSKEDNAIDACDAPLLELHIQISAMWYDRKRLRVENEIFKAENIRLKEQVEYWQQAYKSGTGREIIDKSNSPKSQEKR